MNKPLTTRHGMLLAAALFASSAFIDMATGTGQVKWYFAGVGAVICTYLAGRFDRPLP